MLSHLLLQSNRCLPPELEELVKCIVEQNNCTHLKLMLEQLYYIESYSKERVESIIPHVTSCEGESSILNNNIILFADAINYKLDRVENTHGRLFVSRTLSLLTASRFGLSENELLDILSHDRQVHMMVDAIAV